MDGEEDLEGFEDARLLASSKEKSSALARAAYRADLAKKRAVLLSLLIVPIILIIVAWNLFDSNAHWGSHQTPASEGRLPFTRPAPP